MQINPLSPSDRAYWGATHRIKVGHADVAALGASAAVALNIFPGSGTNTAGLKFAVIAVILRTAFDFSDSAINSLTAEIGDGGDADRFLVSQELAVDGTEILYKAGPGSTSPFIYTSADTVDLTLTASGGANPTLAEATSGEVDIYVFADTVTQPGGLPLN